jgi:hypothetical protein
VLGEFRRKRSEEVSKIARRAVWKPIALIAWGGSGRTVKSDSRTPDDDV